MVRILYTPPRRTILAGFSPQGRRRYEMAKALGCERIIIGLDDEDDDRKGVDASDYDDHWVLRPQWRGGKIEREVDIIRDLGMQVGVHGWARPVEHWCEEQAEWVQDFHAKRPIDIYIIDTEKHDRRMRAVRGGFDDEDGDGDVDHDDYMIRLQSLHAKPPGDADEDWYRIGAAVYGLPNWRSRHYAPWAEELILMVYFNFKHTGELDDAIALGARCLAAWAREDTTAAITMGYGAYDQRRAGVSTEAAMVRVHEAMHRLGSKSDAIWALGHVARSAAARRAIARYWGEQ